MRKQQWEIQNNTINNVKKNSLSHVINIRIYIFAALIKPACVLNVSDCLIKNVLQVNFTLQQLYFMR